MAENRPSAAWRILRMALRCARKGGAFRRWRLMLGLRVALKSLRNGGGGARADRIRYMERELSFDETPAFSFKMSRPASLRFPKIPCIGTSAPLVNDHHDVGEDWMFENRDVDDRDEEEDEYESSESEEEEEEINKAEGIDVKAEEFISKFYEQMKLQRQISLIRYNEMIQRGAN